MPYRFLSLLLTLTLMFVPTPAAHETDQFTIPLRPFADMGDGLTRWAHRVIASAVDNTNAEIREALAAKASRETLNDLQSAERLVNRVNGQIPWAGDVIEGLDKRANSSNARHKYPGMLTAHKDALYNVYSFSSLPFDPRQLIRFVYSSTIKAYGIHFGTDKVGHFTDMGMNYWRDYNKALKSGKTSEQAIREAVQLGTDDPILSESGFLGLFTAGSYSNADLVSNLSGMLFYINVTEPTMIAGQMRPPMVVREGEFWKLNDHVRPDSDFFSIFITEHWDETLNPSVFDGTMRGGIERNIEKHASDILERHADPQGFRRPREWFDAKYVELSTYWGLDYGHKGDRSSQITLAEACFETFKSDADPTARNRFGETPLHQAAQRGDVNRIRELLARGADMNARVVSDERLNSDWGSTPLHYAARDGRYEAAEALIAAGADVNAANALGATPLHRAVRHPRVADLLVADGAKVNAADVRGRTPLHYAAMDRDAVTADLLVQLGASPDVRDYEGRTPLHVAAKTGDMRAVNELLRAGANPTAPDMLGVTPLHLAAGHKSVDAVKPFLSARVDLAVRDSFGQTPLHVAASRGSPAVVASLLSAGGNPNIADAYGNCPLHLAAREGRPEVAVALLTGGANPAAATRAGLTALHIAAVAGQSPVAQVLLAHGVSPDLKTPTGATPAQLATRHNHPEVRELFDVTRPVTASTR